MNILITISYDGTNYFGWQKQNGFATIQQKIEDALSFLLKKNVSVRGSSRTDTGVHSLGQRALFKEDISIPMDKLPYAINSFLPNDIVVTYAEIVDDNFHPQYSVLKKTYEYKILNSDFKNPMLINYTDFVRGNIDVKKMQDACKYFIGEHNFKSFCASGSTAKTTIRTIYDLTVEKKENIITIRVTGNGFLYNMVRIIAGTLIYVGQCKIKVSDIPYIIEAEDRTKAGKTAAACGLTLINIKYKH